MQIPWACQEVSKVLEFLYISTLLAMTPAIHKLEVHWRMTLTIERMLEHTSSFRWKLLRVIVEGSQL